MLSMSACSLKDPRLQSHDMHLPIWILLCMWVKMDSQSHELQGWTAKLGTWECTITRKAKTAVRGKSKKARINWAQQSKDGRAIRYSGRVQYGRNFEDLRGFLLPWDGKSKDSWWWTLVGHGDVEAGYGRRNNGEGKRGFPRNGRDDLRWFLHRIVEGNEINAGEVRRERSKEGWDDELRRLLHSVWAPVVRQWGHDRGLFLPTERRGVN